MTSVLPHRRGYVPPDQLRAYAALAEHAIHRAVEVHQPDRSVRPVEV
ncbi:hypothetical protein [Amnibacterium kyonggiense]